ncbi:MAG: alcohol dehydrogenase catalytic domain-containing protein, partial [Steroidobacteraceae bacterium]
MRSWRIPAGCTSVDQLELVEVSTPVPARGELLIRVRACSINYRDQAIPRGLYIGGVVAVAGTPLSDGAGLIEAVGPDVTAFKPGDRVA